MFPSVLFNKHLRICLTFSIILIFFMFKNVFIDSSCCGLGLRGGGFWEFFLLYWEILEAHVYLFTDLVSATLE